MYKRILSGIVVASICAAVGCSRDDEKPRAETKTQDDFIERTRVIDEVFEPGAPNPAAGGTEPVTTAEKEEKTEKTAQKKTTTQKQARTSATTGGAKKSSKPSTTKSVTAAPAEATAQASSDPLGGDSRADVDPPRQPWDPPPVVGTATITSVVIVPMDAVEPNATDAANPQPQAQPQEHVNESTTLGNGNSGMYTGGQGTYGGRATWGTGARR